MHDDLFDKLRPALQDVPWTSVPTAVDAKIRELRTLADVSTGITVVASLLLRKKPRGPSALGRAIRQWDSATPTQRRAIILDAWRRANPVWAFHPDHDPYPQGDSR